VVEIKNVAKVYCLTTYLPLNTADGPVEIENVPKMYLLTAYLPLKQ
jgi:hypothetical protein